MVENQILKDNARRQLGDRIFEKTWLMMMVIFLIYSAVISSAGSVGFGVGAVIISGPLLYGLNRICVKLVVGAGDILIEDTLVGFKESFVNSLLLSLLTALYTFLWSLLFVIPGIVKSYSYAMAPYILQDSPELAPDECLDASKKMMEGNKWQLFCLDFSFIGWYFVGALCLGIGVFWVEPYHALARANFYMALKAKNDSTRSEASDYEPVDPFN